MHPHPTLTWYDLALIAAAVLVAASLLERRLRAGDPPGWSRALDRLLADQQADDPPDLDDEPAVRLVTPRLYDQDAPEEESLDRLDRGLVGWAP